MTTPTTSGLRPQASGPRARSGRGPQKKGLTHTAPRALIIVLLAGAALTAQGTLDPAMLLQPLKDAWPMYNGDYSGRRFSSRATITAANVPGMTLAWV